MFICFILIFVSGAFLCRLAGGNRIYQYVAKFTNILSITGIIFLCNGGSLLELGYDSMVNQWLIGNHFASLCKLINHHLKFKILKIDYNIRLYSCDIKSSFWIALGKPNLYIKVFQKPQTFINKVSNDKISIYMIVGSDKLYQLGQPLINRQPNHPSSQSKFPEKPKMIKIRLSYT